MSLFNLIFVFAYFLMLSSCGYTLKHRLKDNFETAKKGAICIPWFKNKSLYIGAERIFTNALIRELRGRGQLDFSSDSCNYYIKGEITSISVSPVAFTDPGFNGLQSWRRLPLEYVTNVTLALKLIEKRTWTTLWENSFSQSQRFGSSSLRTHSYEAPSSIGLITESNIEKSFYEIARDMMRDVYDDIVEIF